MVLRLVRPKQRFTGLNVQLSAKVERVIAAERISAEELAFMLRHAAITSLRNFDRRYFHWLFLIQNDCLIDVQRADIVEVGKGNTSMREPHEPCYGEGCAGCGWVGQIARRIKDKKSKSHLWAEF